MPEKLALLSERDHKHSSFLRQYSRRTLLPGRHFERDRSNDCVVQMCDKRSFALNSGLVLFSEVFQSGKQPKKLTTKLKWWSNSISDSTSRPTILFLVEPLCSRFLAATCIRWVIQKWGSRYSGLPSDYADYGSFRITRHEKITRCLSSCLYIGRSWLAVVRW